MSSDPLQPGLLHQRQLPGIASRHLFDWQGIKLKGLYLVESRAESRPVNEQAPLVLLIPGAFDPGGGDYPAQLIVELLARFDLGGVYEGHFLDDGQYGRLNPAALLEDLLNILRNSSSPPLIVGLSNGSMFVAIALFLAGRAPSLPRVKAGLLVGLNMPGYETHANQWIRDSIAREEMGARLAQVTGHPFTQWNFQATRSWLAASRFKPFFDSVQADGTIDLFPIPVEVCSFEEDTLTTEGQRKLLRLLNYTVQPRLLPGRHRSLRQTPESVAAILGFVKRHLPRP